MGSTKTIQVLESGNNLCQMQHVLDLYEQGNNNTKLQNQGSRISVWWYFHYPISIRFDNPDLQGRRKIQWKIWDLSPLPPYYLQVKFIYSEKATKFWEIFSLLLFYVVPVKSNVEISQNFGPCSGYMNFKQINIL